MFLHLQLQSLQWEWEERDIQLLSNFNSHISKSVPSSHLHELACSNHTANKSQPSRAWDLTLVNSREALPRPPCHEVNRFLSHPPRVSLHIYHETTTHPPPSHGTIDMHPPHRVAHCALCSCSHLLLSIDGAPRTRAGLPFLNSPSLAFYETHGRWSTCACYVNEWPNSFILKFKPI